MSKSITVQAHNEATIIGKLLATSFTKGTTKAGAPYERGTLTVRLTQTYGGREETSEVQAPIFAPQYKKDGGLNPMYARLQELKSLKTIQNVGYDAADSIRLNNVQIQENNFVSRSGQLVSGWQLRPSFFEVNSTIKEAATFKVEIFILDMREEMDRDGEPTGRLIVKGGIVQYGGMLDVVEFYVEAPDTIEHISRNWQINDTLLAKGYIRWCAQVEKAAPRQDSWGEDIPESAPRMKRELIITTGDPEGRDEEFAYDPAEIKKAFNVRKANIEQKQASAAKPTTAAAPAASKPNYAWE